MPDAVENGRVNGAATTGNGRMPGAPDPDQPYRELIEWLPVTVYEADVGPEGEWHYVSPNVERLLGFTPEEFTSDGELHYRRLHPDDRDEVMELERTETEMARRDGVTAGSEYRMLHRDGSVVWVRDEARLVQVEGGAPRWRGVLVDISDARAAQQALAQSRDRYRGLVNTLPVCAYIADPASPARRTFLSHHVRELLGYTPEEWAEDPDRWQATLHPNDRFRVLRDEERHAAMAVGTPWVSEYRLLARSGAVIWVRDRALVAEGPDGRRVIDGILTDITAVHNADEGARPDPDVLRLTCSSCGAVRAAERAGPCVECGSGDVTTVSLNAALSEIEAARRQVEQLLDGVHQHLETVSSPDRGGPADASALHADRRLWTRPGGLGV